jgi:hypothetical protein
MLISKHGLDNTVYLIWKSNFVHIQAINVLNVSMNITVVIAILLMQIQDE